MKLASKVVELAQSWVGKNEKDGSYKEIIDAYNSTGPFPRNLKMRYEWAWCACTWSALAKRLGYTDIMPIEISCGALIELAKNMGIWQEHDWYVPSPGDAVLYNWDDTGKGDNIGWPDHIGVVEYVNGDAKYFTVIEGNYSDSVKKRTVSFDGRYIRGFICPEYDPEPDANPGLISPSKDLKATAMEVIAGFYGNGESRKQALESKGFVYQEVQDMVNKILNGSAVKPSIPDQSIDQPIEKTGVKATCKARIFTNHDAGYYKTTADLYCRHGAGTNKKAICLIPKGTTVRCFGYSTNFNSIPWLLIQVTLDGILYEGFSSRKYLKRV